MGHNCIMLHVATPGQLAAGEHVWWQQDLSVTAQRSCEYILWFKNAMAGDFRWEEIVRRRSKERL